MANTYTVYAEVSKVTIRGNDSMEKPELGRNCTVKQIVFKTMQPNIPNYLLQLSSSYRIFGQLMNINIRIL